MPVFQDELDEDDGPQLFQAERDAEHSGFPLQDEADEPDEPAEPNPPVSFLRRSGSSSHPCLFQDEADEESGSDLSSGCMGDCEAEANDVSNQQLVQLSFSTLTQFLESQLCHASTQASSGPEVKKRRYNNRNRAAKAAEAAKLTKGDSKNHRIPRNDPEAVSFDYITCCIFSS